MVTPAYAIVPARVVYINLDRSELRRAVMEAAIASYFFFKADAKVGVPVVQKRDVDSVVALLNTIALSSFWVSENSGVFDAHTSHLIGKEV